MSEIQAYKIETRASSGYSIYIAESSGKAKTCVINSLHDVFRDATYSWIKSCRRVPEFDYLSPNNNNSCVAWVEGGERWQIDRGHWWWGDDPSPKDISNA